MHFFVFQDPRISIGEVRGWSSCVAQKKVMKLHAVCFSFRLSWGQSGCPRNAKKKKKHKNFCEPRLCLLSGEVRRWSSGTPPKKTMKLPGTDYSLCLIRGWSECLRTQKRKELLEMFLLKFKPSYACIPQKFELSPTKAP